MGTYKVMQQKPQKNDNQEFRRKLKILTKAQSPSVLGQRYKDKKCEIAYFFFSFKIEFLKCV